MNQFLEHFRISRKHDTTDSIVRRSQTHNNINVIVTRLKHMQRDKYITLNCNAHFSFMTITILSFVHECSLSRHVLFLHILLFNNLFKIFFSNKHNYIIR